VPSPYAAEAKREVFLEGVCSEVFSNNAARVIEVDSKGGHSVLLQAKEEKEVTVEAAAMEPHPNLMMAAMDPHPPKNPVMEHPPPKNPHMEEEVAKKEAKKVVDSLMELKENFLASLEERKTMAVTLVTELQQRNHLMVPKIREKEDSFLILILRKF
jgi:hypothetical protein